MVFAPILTVMVRNEETHSDRFAKEAGNEGLFKYKA
jgi:hypothetical protein